MAMAPEQTGIGIRRHFTTEGIHPYDEVVWERRDARITNYRDGVVAFEQRGVEFPAGWSLNAANIVAQKYFRGALGAPGREQSLRQVIDRVADTITAWGAKDGYFVDDAEAEAFRAELKHLVVHQKAAFNSPVWFNIGVSGEPKQASACQPYHALVSTPEGLVPIGKLVEEGAVGAKVFDAHGLTRVVAVKANGRKPVLRLHTRSGHALDVTADHLVWRARGVDRGRFVPAGALRAGDRLTWHRHTSWGDGEISPLAVAEAALAGWLQSDRFLGQDEGTNGSLTIEATTVTDAERAWVLDAIEKVFPDAHAHQRVAADEHMPIDDRRRTRLDGEALRDFLNRWDLLVRGPEMTVPGSLRTAPLPVVAGYLRSIFQAEGYVSQRERSSVVGLAMTSEQIVRGIQSLLLRFGIFSPVRFAPDGGADGQGRWVLSVRAAGDRRRFADEIGFIDPAKAGELEATFDIPGRATHDLEHLEIARVEELPEADVYDIETESGEYLSGGLRVHNCFILAVEDTMASILNWYVEEGTIFKGGSGSGINLSNIRSSAEHLKGGGTASGPVSFMRGADASAGTIKCLHADTPVVTDRGVVAIKDSRAGDLVLTRFGYHPVEAVHDNGVRPLVRVRTAFGDEITCTPEHRFWVRSEQGEGWREAGSLAADDHVLIHLGGADSGRLQLLKPVEPGHHTEIRHELPAHLDEAMGMWLGWVYGDGSVTSVPSAEFVAVQIGDGDPELLLRYQALTRGVFGSGVRLYVNRPTDESDASASVRFASSRIIRFLEANGLRRQRCADLRVPTLVQGSPASVRAAFLSGLFEADGHVGNGYVWLSTISRGLALDVHRLLLSLGIPSTIGRIDDRRAEHGSLPVHTVRVVGDEGMRRFAKQVGFVSDRKHHCLEAAVARKDASRFETQWFLPHVAEEMGRVWTVTTDQNLRRALAPYCRYGRPRRMSLLRARALLERFPEELGATTLTPFAYGDELYVPVTVEPAGDGPTFDLTIAGVHEYLVNNVVTHNSGGKTRRAAKMVILNADHPDIEDFIWCKAVEERKARVLRDAGFDMDLDGKDSHSTQYQNANNSVRVTDAFMQAVVEDGDWHLRAVKTGEILRTVKARQLFRQIAEATWECADPGMQFDTTINRWHTAANTGRINGSNPCCFTGETLVDTSDGLVPFELLHKTAQAGLALPEATSFDVDRTEVVTRALRRVWVAGHTDRLVEVTTQRGLSLRCTPEHRFLTVERGWTEAGDLAAGDRLRSLGLLEAEPDDIVASVAPVVLPEPVPVFDLEVEGTHNFAVSCDTSVADHCVVVHNSEYMHLDNSACNLASLNLLKFLAEDGTFDVEGFKAAVEVVFTAQEILVGNADYPTEKIGDNARRFRQLGLGYANLGAMLMALGIAYDSDAGRSWAAAITSLMTGHAYATSARTAARMGPFAGYTENREPMNRVLRMHRDAAAGIDDRLATRELVSAAREAWDRAVDGAEVWGVRNSQASVLAPTGCLVGGSLVATDRGLLRLGRLGDPDGAKWQDLDVQVSTDVGPEAATKFYVNGLEPVVNVHTARGYRIQGTTQHRVKVVDEATGAWHWRRFCDLRPGELVPLALHQLVGVPQDVPLPPWPEAHWTGEAHIETPRNMTPELAELIGHFMGDGSLHPRGLRFCVADADFDVVERLEQLGKEVFEVAASVLPGQGGTEVMFCSLPLALWWEACGFAKGAHIPDAVLHSNDPEAYRAFLRGLFEAGGTVSAGVPSFSSTSPDFASDVQSLMLALGYPTTRRLETTPTGSGQAPIALLRLLNPSYSRRWAAEIGFQGNRKNAAVAASGGPTDPLGGEDPTEAGPLDWIPITRAMADRLAPADDRLGGALLMERSGGRVSRRIATELFERTADAELGRLLSFFYDRVAAAELGDEELTYDISVPENVTYVANGFVSHNTIGLMMDCDTTGIEPDLGLCKTKKLVGGGTMSIVNQTVPRALRRLGYSPLQAEEIIAYIDEHKTILGAPHISSEHLDVFACSMGDNVIHYLGHVRMMAAVQPWISGAISKCVSGDTLLATADGLVRIASLHRGEAPDTFRPEILAVASTDGVEKTDAFYYGGVRPVRKVVLRSGHRIVGTPNHRLQVAGASGLEWRRLDEIEPGEQVATRYGSQMWSAIPARFDDFVPTVPDGGQSEVRVPEEMTAELAFLLGACASGGRSTLSDQTITIANPVDAVLERVVAAWRRQFGIEARIVGNPGECPGVVAASRTVVEFLRHLGCGGATAQRIPDAVLRSPRTMVLAFLQGLALDAHVSLGAMPRWAIRLDAPALLDDLQVVLTNLGIVHGRVSKGDAAYAETHDGLYATGDHARRLVGLLQFLEPVTAEHDDSLQFSPVESVDDAGEQEVFDISVPATSAFVGNGIVNHNTINMPEQATVEEMEQLHIDAWRMGLKAVAVYRDNCKVAQPLSATKKDAAPVVQPVLVKQPVRERLPRMRNSKTFSFRVADCHGYVTVGEYDDGRPGEIFLRVAKQGSTLAGIMDAFAISVSHGLQYGVPLRAFVDMYTNMRFEPAGITDDAEIRFASSLVDYIFRRLAVEYLSPEERADLGILTVEERMQPTLPGVEEQATPTSTGADVVPDPAPVPGTPAPPYPAKSPTASDAPYCYVCGVVMQRAGACFVCSGCGTTSGCS